MILMANYFFAIFDILVLIEPVNGIGNVLEKRALTVK